MEKGKMCDLGLTVPGDKLYLKTKRLKNGLRAANERFFAFPENKAVDLIDICE